MAEAFPELRGFVLGALAKRADRPHTARMVWETVCVDHPVDDSVKVADVARALEWQAQQGLCEKRWDKLMEVDIWTLTPRGRLDQNVS